MSVSARYKLAFVVTPIWLTGGKLESPGQKLPFAMLTDPDLYNAVANNPSADDNASINLDNAFGSFQVIPTGTLVQQTSATYPFANQAVASNATIFEPLTVSLIWDVPMRTKDAWVKKFNIIQKVQATLTEHNNNGGTYTVITPSFIYETMLLLGMSDSSRGQNPIPQNAWRFDFQKPLIRLSDLVAAQSVLMNKLDKGLPTDGNWSGVAAGQGTSSPAVQFMSQSVASMPSALGTLAIGGGVPV